MRLGLSVALSAIRRAAAAVAAVLRTEAGTPLLAENGNPILLENQP